MVCFLSTYNGGAAVETPTITLTGDRVIEFALRGVAVGVLSGGPGDKDPFLLLAVIRGTSTWENQCVNLDATTNRVRFISYDGFSAIGHVNVKNGVCTTNNFGMHYTHFYIILMLVMLTL